jgi:two-component system nitrogen regulation response regulator GlnG
VLLDEIGDMPFGIQAKILRLLQEKSIERLGGREPIPVDVRIIGATNRDLEAALSDGRFREDLYYRLKVVTLWLPPLRERTGDIALLADYFLARFAAEMEMGNPGLTVMAKAMLSTHSWPGNVRELANALQKAIIFSRGCPIGPEDVARGIGSESPTQSSDGEGPDETIRQWIRKFLVLDGGENTFETFMDHFAAILITEALNFTGGNRTRAAKLLGLSRPTLLSKIEKYRLKVEASVTSEA